MKAKSASRSRHSAGGFSVIELLIVAAIFVAVAAIALPQILASRRLLRFNAVSREMTSLLRFARQQAMSQRQVFRVRYDDAAKQIVVIDNEEAGPVNNPVANNPLDDRTIKTLQLDGMGIPASEIKYGQPYGAPASLADGTSLTPLAAGRVEVAFQPDGSVVDANGNPVGTALFFYNSEAPAETLRAVSILGSGGRVKSWRYSSSANAFVN